MESAGLLSLPVEALHHIGSFLSGEDILACSATCHYLRFAFNDNNVWKKYVSENVISDLQNNTLHPMPKVFDPEFSLETLTPLCENQIAVIKKANILNNWKNARFVKLFIESSDQYQFPSLKSTFDIEFIFSPIIVGNAFYKDCYLFLVCYSKKYFSNAIEVWDLKTEPVLLLKQPLKVTIRDKFGDIFIVGDCLVITKIDCVQVRVHEIKISEKALPLLFSFLVTDSDVVLNEPLNHFCRCYGWTYCMADHYLFANKCEDEPYSCIFHIWDITNACKVGSFVPPIPGMSIHYHSLMDNKWLLQMFNRETMDDLYFFQFDIERKEFSEHVFHIEKQIIHSMTHNSYLIFMEESESNLEGCFETICSVHDFTSSLKLQERRFKDAKLNLKISSTEVINGQFVMVCIDGFHVVDAQTLETLQRFPNDNFSARFITHQLNIFGSVFILAANRRNTLEIWDVSRKKKVEKNFNAYYESILYINESCTKVACLSQNEISVFHFL